MAELELVCVPTRILTDNDDIVDAIVEFGGHNIGPEDIVCVAESVVAITQGRFTRPEELNVCWQARMINRFIHQDVASAPLCASAPGGFADDVLSVQPSHHQGFAR